MIKMRFLFIQYRKGWDGRTELSWTKQISPGHVSLFSWSVYVALIYRINTLHQLIFLKVGGLVSLLSYIILLFFLFYTYNNVFQRYLFFQYTFKLFKTHSTVRLNWLTTPIAAINRDTIFITNFFFCHIIISFFIMQICHWMLWHQTLRHIPNIQMQTRSQGHAWSLCGVLCFAEHLKLSAAAST